MKPRCISGKKPLLIFSFFFLPTAYCLLPTAVCFSQNPDIKRTYHWYFGNGAGIDFSSGTAVADTTGNLHTYEGTAVMSDTAGNLLFYTDGDTVWNKNHQPMPNGTGLMGCGNWGSSAQAGLIVPQPSNDSLFYVFTTDCWENSGAAGFRYSIVNIKLNGGLGDVISKNNLLFVPSTEALAATKHGNGKDIWVMTHEFNTNNFFAYKIDDTLGLITIPVISSIGMSYTDYIAAIKFSPNGKKMAAAYDNISGVDQLFDFDSQTGQLYNLVNLPGLSPYSLEFSPDNSKLYYMTSGNWIYQFCLSAGNDSMSISPTKIDVSVVPGNDTYGELQLALDGTIRIASLFNDSISTIVNPNNYGISCNVIPRNFYLDGKQSELGLPIFISNYFHDSTLVLQNCDSTNGIFENTNTFLFNIYPNPASQTLFLYCNTFDKNATLKFYNVLGLLLDVKIFHPPNDAIDISNISNGIYFIKVETSNKIYSHKLIINQ